MFFTKPPYLQMPCLDGITVMWETDLSGSTELWVWEAFCPACGEAAYSPAGEPLHFFGEAGPIHKARAEGLKPGTDYCYQAVSSCGDDTLKSRLQVFRTQPVDHAPLSFAVTSETGGSQSPLRVMESLVSAIAAERPDFMLFVGDMVNDGRQPRDWDEYLFIPFRGLIGHTPFYHCAGNHEEHAELMRHILASPPEGYYAFTYGCAQFIALDSTLLSDHVADAQHHYVITPTVPLDESNPQIRFLIAALEKSQSPWKFVYIHYPPYFAGTWEAPSLRPLCAIFEKYKVDIVFTSHAIVYERSHPLTQDALDFEKGVRYIVAGGAGARPEWFHHKKAWHTAKNRAVPHFLHVSVTPSHLELQAIDFEGRLFDTLMLDKPPHKGAQSGGRGDA